MKYIQNLNNILLIREVEILNNPNTIIILFNITNNNI